MSLEFPSEKYIEDYVWQSLQAERYCPVSDEHFDLFLRQKEIPGYGITDIIKIAAFNTGEIDIRVLELKNEPLKESHVSQLYRYITGVRRIAERYMRLTDCPEISVRGELAGPFDKSRGDFVYLLQAIRDIDIYDLSLSMSSGFKSELVGDSWFNASEKLTGHKALVRQIAEKYQKQEAIFLEDLMRHRSNKVVNLRGDDNA